MQEIGKQYLKDNKMDTSGFLSKARLHQSKYRAEILNLPCGEYGNYLIEQDAKKGGNFYDGLGIFDAVKKRNKKYSKALYANMLRSEHVPFNFFIPLDKNKVFAKEILNSFLDKIIKSIDRIEIEYAPPKPKEKYLNDRTSFDTYIEYTHVDNSKGILGIEVKYTERAYSLKIGSKQELDINNSNSSYYQVTEKSKLYNSTKPKSELFKLLKSDDYRQVWRNHILGESILLADGNKFKHFTSITIFPKGNSHFEKISEEYVKLLNDKKKFVAITYEDFFKEADKNCPDEEYKKWIEYLTKRYIVDNAE